jgi:hypothetical protein
MKFVDHGSPLIAGFRRISHWCLAAPPANYPPARREIVLLRDLP